MMFSKTKTRGEVGDEWGVCVLGWGRWRVESGGRERDGGEVEFVIN